MTCSCPKCDARIDINLARIPTAGHYTPCPSCRSRFWAQRESFISRAFKKEGKVYCVECDAELGFSHNCPQCSTLLPDYCLVQKSKPPQRKKDSNFSLNLSFSSGGGRVSSIPIMRSGTINKAPYVKFAVVALVIAISVATFFIVKNSKAEKAYVANYIRALHGVKTGADRSISIFSQMKESIGYGITTQDIDEINASKAEIDKRMLRLEESPSKYINQKEKIKSLYVTYSKMYNLTINSPSAASIDNAMALEAEFNKAALALKSSLPHELSAELKNASIKYRNMGIFVD